MSERRAPRRPAIDVLLTGWGADREAVDLARRTAPYRRLVVFAPDADDAALHDMARLEATAGVATDVRAVDPLDLMGCLGTIRRALEQHQGDRIHFHVAGGPNALTSAALLAAFQMGVPAFYCHARGVSHLPVANAVGVDERFTSSERAVLATMPERGETGIEDLASTGLAPSTVKDTLLRLRSKGLVRADHRTASLTPTGRYYREATHRSMARQTIRR